MNIQRHKRIAALAKAGLPKCGWTFSSGPAQRALSAIETACALLQGKGSGSGWDMKGEIRAALQFIRPGDVVFDVGANRGEWSTSIHDHLNGWEGFYLFEPQRSCYPYLSHLQSAGATVVEAAVGEKPCTATLLSPGDSAGNASLYPRKDSFFKTTVFSPLTVPMVSLDDFMAERKIENVAFMKMDIEGHELAAMRGASYALSHGMIKALQFEFGSGNINSNTMFRDHWDLLRGHGYRLLRVLIGGRLLAIERYDENLEHYRGVSNYIAVRSG